MRSPAFPLVVIPFLGRLLMVSGVDSSMGFRRGLHPCTYAQLGSGASDGTVSNRWPSRARPDFPDYSRPSGGAQGPAGGTAGHLGPVAPSEQQRGKALVRGRGRKAAKSPDPGACEGLAPASSSSPAPATTRSMVSRATPLAQRAEAMARLPDRFTLRRMLGELVREAVVVDEPDALEALQDVVDLLGVEPAPSRS